MIRSFPFSTLTDDIISQMLDVPKGSPEYQKLQAALDSLPPPR